jgi:hypothetical protein
VLCGAGAIARESQQRRLHSSSGDSGNIALWSKRTSFGSAGKASSTLTGASNPVAGSGQRVAADIAISRAEIGFSFGSDDDAVNHLPSRVFRLQFVEHLIGGASCTVSGLGQTPADARYDVKMAGDLLVCGGIEKHSLGFAIHGKH